VSFSPKSNDKVLTITDDFFDFLVNVADPAKSIIAMISGSQPRRLATTIGSYFKKTQFPGTFRKFSEPERLIPVPYRKIRESAGLTSSTYPSLAFRVVRRIVPICVNEARRSSPHACCEMYCTGMACTHPSSQNDWK
jgi:hypothetical protein